MPYSLHLNKPPDIPTQMVKLPKKKKECAYTAKPLLITLTVQNTDKSTDRYEKLHKGDFKLQLI